MPWMAFSINNLISAYILNKSVDRLTIQGFISFVAGAFSFLFLAIPFYGYTLTSNMF